MKMKKKIYLLTLWGISLAAYSQIGINVESPKTTLDIGGSLQITNELHLGGNGSTKGSAGNFDDVLTSQGVGKSPLWKSLPDMNVPTIIYSTAKRYSNSEKPNIAPNIGYQVFLPNNSLDLNLIQFVDNTTLRVIKAGTYLITYNVNVTVSETLTDGTLITYVSKQQTTEKGIGMLQKNSAYAVAPKPISVNSAGVVLLEAGTKLRFMFSHTRTTTLDQYAVTITFLSEK